MTQKFTDDNAAAPLHPVALKDEPHLMRLQNDYSDDELLIELRRRGRIARLEVSDTTPAQYCEMHTIAMQFHSLMKTAGHEMAHRFGHHSRLPGAKITDARGVPGDHIGPPSRRMTIPINIIVNKD